MAYRSTRKEEAPARKETVLRRTRTSREKRRGRKTYVALFRGVNIGGNHPLPMKELRTILETLGAENVTTYVQSGNAVFRHGAAAKELEHAISAAVLKARGFKPRVLVGDRAALERAIAANPFPEAEQAPKSLHVFFLEQVPIKPDLAALDRIRNASERFLLKRDLFYLHAPDGVGRSKLVAQVEKALGTAATGRNWRTVLALRDLAQQGDAP